MQAKKRYLLLFVTCAFLGYCYFGGYRLKGIKKAYNNEYWKLDQLQTYATLNEEFYDKDLKTYTSRSSSLKTAGSYHDTRNCRMENCFDFTKCSQVCILK